MAVSVGTVAIGTEYAIRYAAGIGYSISYPSNGGRWYQHAEHGADSEHTFRPIIAIYRHFHHGTNQ